MFALLKFGYSDDALAPALSPDLLTLHRNKYHAAYVNGANSILLTINRFRND